MSEQLRFPILDDEGSINREPRTSLVCADVLAWAESYEGPPFHAMLTDCPYELSFMGRGWDGTGISFKPETWKSLAQHLLPGAFIIAFSGARTYHRLACALEDAGLILHPCVGFLTGQGFPKATRIDTQVDAHGGQHIGWFGPWLRQWREEHGISQKELARHFLSKTGGFTGCVANWELGLNMPTVEQYNTLVQVLKLPFRTLEKAAREVLGPNPTYRKLQDQPSAYNLQRNPTLTAPASPLAQAWAGHRYGLQALKPALELIAVAQKPYNGKPVESITQTGAGTLWIDGGRIGRDDDRVSGGSQGSMPQPMSWGMSTGQARPTGKRWPPNFALSHHPECRRVGERRHETVPAYDCHPSCVVAALDQQAGVRKSGGTPFNRSGMGYHGAEGQPHVNGNYGDTGAASRFFHVSDWSLDVAEQLAHAAPAHYSEKSSPKERDLGLLGQLPCLSAEQPDVVHDGDPVCTTRHYRIDAQRQPILDTHGEIAWSRCRRNGHPTVKPLALSRWLATLLLPPDAYVPRRILVPFAGVMSEVCGAILSGWEDITAIEQDASYCEIGRARIAYWSEHARNE